MKDNVIHKTNKVLEKALKDHNTHLEKLALSAGVHALRKTYAQLTCVQLKALIAPLKRKGDPATPSKKADLIRTLESWKDRTEVEIQPPSLETLQALVVVEVAKEDVAEDVNDDEYEEV